MIASTAFSSCGSAFADQRRVLLQLLVRKDRLRPIHTDRAASPPCKCPKTPLLVRDIGTQEVYALTVKWP